MPYEFPMNSEKSSQSLFKEGARKLLCFRLGVPTLEHVYSNGLTPLAYYSDIGDPEMVDRCIKCGAQINGRSTNAFNRTPLHFAAAIGYTLGVKILCEANADPSLQDSQGNTPLHLASGGANREVVENLLDEARDANLERAMHVQNIHGYTPLHTAAYYNRFENMKLIIKASKSIPGYIDMQNTEGLTALHLAAGAGHVEAVKILIAQPNMASRDKKEHNTGA